MISKLLRQIRYKRHREKLAGIYCMTADEMLVLALASPHWREIGQGKNKYHFCRRNHAVGYTPENTFIGLGADNIRERLQRRGCPLGPLGLDLTDEQRRQRRQHQRDALKANRRKNNYYRNYREKKKAERASKTEPRQ